MRKIDMACEIARQLFKDDSIDQFNWKVKDLMKCKKDDLQGFYKLAMKAKKAYEELDKHDDEIFYPDLTTFFKSPHK